jgi:hypothetical protein
MYLFSYSVGTAPLDGSRDAKDSSCSRGIRGEFEFRRNKNTLPGLYHIPLKVVINILNTVAPNHFWETVQEALFRCIKKAKTTLETISDSAMETDTELEEEPSLAPLPTISTLDRNAKATKLDDAEISEYLWNETIFPSGGLGKSKPSTC